MGDSWNAANPRATYAVAAMKNSAAPTKVTVTTASTVLVPADPDREYPVSVTVLSGGPVFTWEHDAATTDGFPVANGTIIEHTSTRALNGIVSTGTADVRTWPNGGAS